MDPIILPLLVAIVSGGVFLLPIPAKALELTRLTFGGSVLVTVLVFAHESVRLFS